LDAVLREGEGGWEAKGGTALMLAAAKGHAAIVDMLLSAGALLEIANESGHTAFHYVCSPAEGETDAHVKCMELLVLAGCNIKAADKDGVLGGMWARKYGCTILRRG
jgi:ankyrin repeat protein